MAYAKVAVEAIVRDAMTYAYEYIMNLFTACRVVQAVVNAKNQSYGISKILAPPHMAPKPRNGF